MRQSRWQLTEEFRKKLLGYEKISPDEADRIISVELMIYGCQLIDRTIPIKEAWSIIPGFDEPVLPNYIEKPIVYRLRMLFSEYRFKKNWLKDYEAYFKIDINFRMYVKSEREFVEVQPVYGVERKDRYHNLLNSPIKWTENEIPFASSGSYSYKRMIDQEFQSFEGKIPNSIKQNQKFEFYQSKKRMSFPLTIDWNSIAVKMDYKIQKNDVYETRVDSLVFKSVTPSQQKFFPYEGIEHIGGGLGAGKSTFMVLETYRLVTEAKAKIGFVEGSVPQVLKRVKELQELGLNAVPIIGKSQRKKHEERFLSSIAEDIKEISDLSLKKYQSLSSVSDRCTIKALANDFERNNYYPCTSLKQERKKVKCPLAHTCGVYKDFTKLIEADVWVATPASVLQIKLPPVIDPFERTIYQAMYDLLDVIFVDEADQVQKQFDEAFLDEYPVFGKKGDIFETLEQQASQMLTGKYNEYATDSLIVLWKNNIRMLDRTVWKLFGKIKQSVTLKNDLKQKVIWIKRMIEDLSKKMSNNSEEKKKEIARKLWEFAEEAFTNEGLGAITNELERSDDFDEKMNILNNCVKTLGGKIEQPKLYDQLEFFLYLARVDYGLKFVLTYYPAVQNRLGTGFELSPLLTMAEEYRPFLKDALTGVMFGYRYEVKDGEAMGSFKLIEYSGIGRLLLHSWNNVYEIESEKKGPAIVLLSGTSHLPGSAHYDLQIEPKWLIQTTKPLPKLKQTCLTVQDESLKPISISGLPLYERSENLKKMVIRLKRDIEYELDFWSKEKRRVLLVVNSYEDINAVGQAFQNDLNWNGRYKLLAKDNKIDKVYFPRSIIEEFSKENCDVLTVPLLAVNRGYNILDEQKKALFGSVFFLVRPYPVPNDISYIIQTLHAQLPQIVKRIKDSGFQYEKAINNIRFEGLRRFEAMYKKPEFWSILTNKEREILSWYLFVPVWQMIGRLLRGGRNARVFYCDAKFQYQPNNDIPSLLGHWLDLMKKHNDDPVFYNLYQPLKDSIHQAVKEEIF